MKRAPKRALKSPVLLRLENDTLERIAAGHPLKKTLGVLRKSIDSLAKPAACEIVLEREPGPKVAKAWSAHILDREDRRLGTFVMRPPRGAKKSGGPTKEQRELIAAGARLAGMAIERQREEAVQATSASRLRLAMRVGKIGVWEWEPGPDRFQSDELQTRMSRPRGKQGAVKLADFLNLVYPEDRERTASAIRGAFQEGRDYVDQFRMIGRDSSLRWVSVLGRCEADSGGAPARVVGVVINETDRWKSAEEIHLREGQLAAAQRLAHFGSYEWDPLSGRVERSEELFRIFGVQPHEFEPTLEGYLARVHPDDRAATAATIERAFHEGQPFSLEERIVRPGGEIRVLHSQGQWEFDAAGKLVKLVGTCQDITSRRRADQQLQNANAALQALSARLIGAQEEERARIARELHDDLNQQIAVVSMALGNLKKSIPEDNPDLRSQGERIRQKLVNISEGVRRLCHELHPAILEHAGVAAALSRYCTELRELSALRVALRTEGKFEDIPAASALAIYRVAQEALQNVIKHAGPCEVSVSLSERNGEVSLQVSDNGAGLPPGQGQVNGGGLGLISMKERARLVKGTLAIESQPGAGTTIRLRVPQATP